MSMEEHETLFSWFLYTQTALYKETLFGTDRIIKIYADSMKLTQPVVCLIWIAFMFPPSAAYVLKYHSHVTEDDQWRGQDWSFMECHNKLIPLKLPDLIRYRFNFKKCVAKIGREENGI